MPLRSGGLISGLDTNTLIAQLVDLERMPIKKLEAKKQAYQSQLSLLGGIKGALSDLEDKIKDLDSLNELIAMSAGSTNEAAFTADATGDAAAASYTIEVDAVATAEKNRSVGFSTPSDVVQAGTLSIDIKGGGNQDVTIDAGDTLKDVIAKINDTVEGATASLISDGTSFYLSLTADDTGHTVGGDPSDAIVITESYGGGGGQTLSLAEIAAAGNAQITLDGLNVESEKNDIQAAVSDVTIHVKKVTTGPETLTVAPDKAEIETKLQEFVDSYNKAIELVQKEMKVTAQTNRATTLAGDSAIRNLKQALSGVATFQVPSLAGTNYNALSTFGITTDSLGKLSLNSGDLQDALDDDIQNVTKAFTASDGIADNLLKTLDSYTSSDGVLSARTDGINKSIKHIDTRIFSMELRVQSFETNLVRQYSALESTISAIQAQGNFLASALI